MSHKFICMQLTSCEGKFVLQRGSSIWSFVRDASVILLLFGVHYGKLFFSVFQFVLGNKCLDWFSKNDFPHDSISVLKLLFYFSCSCHQMCAMNWNTRMSWCLLTSAVPTPSPMRYETLDRIPCASGFCMVKMPQQWEDVPAESEEISPPFAFWLAGGWLIQLHCPLYWHLAIKLYCHGFPWEEAAMILWVEQWA